MTQRETNAALKFIAANKNKPFFLYLPHNMPGSSRQPFASEAFRGQSKNGVGDAVEELDWAAGQILTRSKNITSTNAPWSFGPATTAPRAAIRRRAATLHSAAGATPRAEGGMRVPAIVRWPNFIPAGSVSDELCT